VLWLGAGVLPAQAQDNGELIARPHESSGSGIASPLAGAEVSGLVSVQGTAVHPTFRKWQLDLLIDGDEQQPHFVALGEQAVSAPSELAELDSRLYHNGKHVLRLRVVYQGLNYDEYYTPITIANSGAPASAVAGADTASDASADNATDAEKNAIAEPAPVVFRTDAPADGKKWIEIDISDQKLTAWQGDVPVFETIVSTGKPGWRTLPGAFAVYRKYESTRMTGPDYDTPDVPWTMYYSGGFAIHGAYWHDNFGTPVSHGCVNLRVPEAKVLYEWAPMGTEVVVNQ
jgi:lipoprotein-anchoring transpeptidase ErfK/SrfK